jgi:hypothetical protein
LALDRRLTPATRLAVCVTVAPRLRSSSRVEARAANGDLGRNPPVGLVRRRVG